MGLAATQARSLMLIARRSDLQYSAQILNYERMALSNQAIQITSYMADLQPGSDALELAQRDLTAINEIDKNLQMQLARVDNQNDIVEKDLETLKPIIQKAIESFKFGGN
jgi:multisubunit Na+/H+ antiporter MnhE subunit